jgi:deazaflavin-dependent oxidoreductase (nitroreductase family)
VNLDGERFCYLTTRGRRTGNPHEIEIWYAARERTVYVLAGDGEKSDTVKNLRAHPVVAVRIGAETYDGTARFIQGTDEAKRARAIVPKKYEREEDGLDEWAAEALPIAIDLS